MPVGEKGISPLIFTHNMPMYGFHIHSMMQSINSGPQNNHPICVCSIIKNLSITRTVNLFGNVYVCMCICVCICVRVYVCMCICVCMCML